MRVKIGKPQPKQDEFLKAVEKFIAYGGARGGGKSWAVRLKILLLALAYPGIKMILIRRTYAQVINNHLAELKILFFMVAKYNKTEKVFTFFNGSTLKLGYCANDDDADHGRLTKSMSDIFYSS